MTEQFNHLAKRVTTVAGSPYATVIAFVLVLLWLVSGPIFGFSQTWQLVINTGTTIITFLMVFIIQNTSNREVAALHAKVDKLLVLLAHHQTTDRRLMDAENLTEKEIEGLKEEIRREDDANA